MHLCAVALTLLLVAPGHAGAQTQDTGRVAAVLALRLGQQVRVDLTGNRQVEGRLALGSDTSLTLIRHDVPAKVRLPDVERLWVRGRATGRGALLGAGVGTLAGVLYGLLISDVACEPVDGGDCSTLEVAAVAGLLGGAGGAAVGAGIGSVIPIWRLRFP